MTRDRARRGGKLQALALVALLSACGGGSSDDVPPTPTGPPGTLDASFGTAGIVLTTPSSPVAANAIAVQPDGKIVVAGSIGDGTGKSFYLVRYKPDGNLDAEFGTSGAVITVLDRIAGSEARAVVLQPDGKIVALGASGGACALARYNADGTLDPGFGTGGTVQSRSAREDVGCTSAVLQPDGKILGAVDDDPGLPFFRLGSVMRFNRDGSRDMSFGAMGEAELDCLEPEFTGGCRASRIEIRPDGRIIVAGARFRNFTRGGLRHVYVMQLTPDGTPDSQFGSGGFVILGQVFNDCPAGGLVVQPDGKTVIVAGAGCYQVTRIAADGALDAGYGTAGNAASPDAGGNFAGRTAALQVNGKVIVGGDVDWLTPASRAVALTRYGTNGGLDVGFGTAGLAKTRVGISATGNAVTTMSDGRIVVAGNVTAESGPQGIFVGRYFGDLVAH